MKANVLLTGFPDRRRVERVSRDAAREASKAFFESALLGLEVAAIKMFGHVDTGMSMAALAKQAEFIAGHNFYTKSSPIPDRITGYAVSQRRRGSRKGATDLFGKYHKLEHRSVALGQRWWQHAVPEVHQDRSNARWTISFEPSIYQHSRHDRTWAATASAEAEFAAQLERAFQSGFLNRVFAKFTVNT